MLETSDDRARAHALAEQWAVQDPPDDLRGQLTFFRGLLSPDPEASTA